MRRFWSLLALGLVVFAVGAAAGTYGVGQLRWVEVGPVSQANLWRIGDALADDCLDLQIVVPTQIDLKTGKVLLYTTLSKRVPPPGPEGCSQRVP